MALLEMLKVLKEQQSFGFWGFFSNEQREEPQVRYMCAVLLGFLDWIVVVLVLLWIFLGLLRVV